MSSRKRPVEMEAADMETASTNAPFDHSEDIEGDANTTTRGNASDSSSTAANEEETREPPGIERRATSMNHASNKKCPRKEGDLLNTQSSEDNTTNTATTTRTKISQRSSSMTIPSTTASSTVPSTSTSTMNTTDSLAVQQQGLTTTTLDETSLLPSQSTMDTYATSTAAAAAETNNTTTSSTVITPSQQQKPAKMAKTDKSYKGLRHFSMMVCKKVEEKGSTTYNEVADELVGAVLDERKQGGTPTGDGGGTDSASTNTTTIPSSNSLKFDEKNIRRRVYDALNVLMAMDIITKDKKEIRWKGLPTNAAQDIEMLEREYHYRQQEIIRKREAMMELLVQQVAFRNLMEHNQIRETHQEGGGIDLKIDNKIPLPFIVVNTHSSAVIQCNMSRDLTDVMFDFSMPFEINDDNTILKRLGMHRTNIAVLRDLIPDDMLSYCQQHKMLDGILMRTEQDGQVLEGSASSSNSSIHHE